LTAAAPIRVCHLVSDDVWGGAESVVRGLIQAQTRQAEVAPFLIALNDGGLCEFARNTSIPVRVVSESEHGFLGLVREVALRLRDLHPHVIHTHRYKENLISLLLCRRIDALSVVTLHGDEPPATFRGRLKVRLRRAVTHWLGARVGARYATVSRDLPALLGLPDSQWVMIPNGISLPQPARGRDELRARSASPVTVGWVGRLVPVKGLPLLLEAIAALPPSLAETRLLLVGDGPERASLEALAIRLGLCERAEFRGFVANPADEYERMDVFALPSLYEGIPIALLEAMGAGLPCVVAAVGGIPDMLRGRDAVRLVASRRAEDWAAMLSSLLSNPVEAHALGMRARTLVSERFSIDAVADAYLGIYRAAVGSART